MSGSPEGETRMMNETTTTSTAGTSTEAAAPMDEQIARIVEQAQAQVLQLTGEGGVPMLSVKPRPAGRGCIACGL